MIENEKILVKLMIACGEGDIYNVKSYIELGVCINLLNNGVSPLRISIENEKYEVVKILLENGANVENSLYYVLDSASDSYHNGFNDLTNYIKITKLLLSYGADITELKSDYEFQQEVSNKILKEIDNVSI
jgi:ankyrin repeat protein